MAKYKVYEREDKVTQTGKKLAKLVLQKEGAQYPTKNVTMWEDFPDFDNIKPGMEIDVDLVEKDQEGTVNPHNGKPYKNRTIYPVKEAPQGSNSPSNEFKDLEGRVIAIEKHLGLNGEVSSDEIPF